MLVLASALIFRTLGSLRDGLAALIGRIPGGTSPRRRKRRPQAAPLQAATTETASATGATTTGANATGASATAANATGETTGSPTAETESAAADAKPRARKPRRWPSKYRAIADFIGDDAAAIAARLRALLADPEAVAYIRANPEFARLLRPLCRGFRVRLIPELRRKPAFRFDEAVEEIEETLHVEPESPAPPESNEPSPAPPPAPTPAPQPSPTPPPQPPMYGIGPPDWTPTDPGPSMKERVDRWLARQRAMGLI